MDPIHSNYTNVRTRQIVTARSDFQHISQKTPGFFYARQPTPAAACFPAMPSGKGGCPAGRKMAAPAALPGSGTAKKIRFNEKTFSLFAFSAV
ncbi:MAG TPA: hypothetical protein H9945_00170 [Candidatus Gemmiger avicola]|uniref:Uncharacterized protein n=1 Tax=Candidatus Gemmiger avicola TaxID=2838605 RepID=A0A9D2S1Q1_9FIRM|nr:hypothetical protein [Candidatus Gemmiger avicola]